MFLYYLKIYLNPVKNNERTLPINIRRLGDSFDLYKNIRLFCYVLMPNHFHFLIQQSSEDAIVELMRRLSNAYVRYFNDKYNRVE